MTTERLDDTEVCSFGGSRARRMRAWIYCAAAGFTHTGLDQARWPLRCSTRMR